MPPFEAPSTTASESSTTVNSHASAVSGPRGASRPPSSHLRPEDAFHPKSPPRKVRKSSPLGRSDTITASNVGTIESRRKREKRRGRSGSRRAKGTWKKLLWVKQACMFNCAKECYHTRTFCDTNLCDSRPGQLHRRRNIPRPPATKPTSTTLRVLATCRRLDDHCAARLLRYHLHLLFHRHLPRASLARLGCQLGNNRHSLGLGVARLLGQRGGGSTSHTQCSSRRTGIRRLCTKRRSGHFARR